MKSDRRREIKEIIENYIGMMYAYKNKAMEDCLTELDKIRDEEMDRLKDKAINGFKRTNGKYEWILFNGIEFVPKQEIENLKKEILKLHTYGDQYKEDYHDMKDERDRLWKRKLSEPELEQAVWDAEWLVNKTQAGVTSVVKSILSAMKEKREGR